MEKIPHAGSAVNRSSVPARTATASPTISAELAAANRALLARRQPIKPIVAPLVFNIRRTPVSTEPTGAPGTVAVDSALLLGLLRTKQVAIGRIWLLAKLHDSDQRGWVDVGMLRAALCDKESPTRCVGWRRLRQLLQAGEGVAWQRDGQGRLWLHGTAKMALTLRVTRLAGQRAQLTAKQLCAPIAALRADFYACFHAQRASTAPISRACLATLTALTPRTQLNYDKRANIDRRPHFALGGRLTDAATVEEQRWRQGRAAFTFVDAKGLVGRPREKYLAWRLPNSYSVAAQGSQPQRTALKRYNCRSNNRKLRQLQTICSDLAKIGERGNGTNASEPAQRGQIYSHVTRQRHGLYWPSQQDGIWLTVNGSETVCVG